MAECVTTLAIIATKITAYKLIFAEECKNGRLAHTNFVMGIFFLIAIIFIYGFLGYKLNKNYILWGLMGLGIMIAPPILVVMYLWIFNDKTFMIVVWPGALLTSLLLSVGIAGIIAFKNNSVFKKGSSDH